MLSTPESPHKARAVGYISEVSLSFKFKFHSKELPFFVIFGRDTVTNLSQLTKPKLRYMGTADLILDVELMSNIFQTQMHT